MKKILFILSVLLVVMGSCNRTKPTTLEYGPLTYSTEQGQKFEDDSLIAMCLAMPCPTAEYQEFTISSGVPFCEGSIDFVIDNWCFYTDGYAFTLVSTYNVQGLEVDPDYDYCTGTTSTYGLGPKKCPVDTPYLRNISKNGYAIYEVRWERSVDGANPCGGVHTQLMKIRVVNYLF